MLTALNGLPSLKIHSVIDATDPFVDRMMLRARSRRHSNILKSSLMTHTGSVPPTETQSPRRNARRKLRRFFRTLLVFPYRLVLLCWWPILGLTHQPQTKKHILFCFASEMMLPHACHVADLIRDDPRFDVCFAAHSVVRQSDTTGKELADKLGVRHVTYTSARLRWWDLIFYPEHIGADQFHPGIDKVHIQHGYDSGKLFGGKDLRYDPRKVLDKNGQPKHTRIFESSLVTRNKAVAQCPVLKDRIAVVGDLGADWMQTRQHNRNNLRQEHGFAETDIVVFVMSTWRSESLMETIGAELVEQANTLLNRYRFVFSTHPNHWQGEYAKTNSWGQFLASQAKPGFTVIRPDDEWETFAVIADMAIADHSSVGVKFALLEKPLVFIKRRPGLTEPDTFGTRLYEALPHLDMPSMLDQTIRQALKNYPIDALCRISREINAWPGEATSRIKAEIHQILGIPPS